METRVKFLPGEQRVFLLQAQEKSGLHPDQLARLAGVVPRSYRDWKREKLCMSLKAVKVFREKYEVTLLEDSKTLVSRWKKHKSEMARRGGFAHFKTKGSYSWRQVIYFA